MPEEIIKKKRLKIVMSPNSIDIEQHARDTIKAIKAQEMRKGTAHPYGIQSPLYVHICDDCHEAYADREYYGLNHAGCKGSPEKNKLGFN